MSIWQKAGAWYDTTTENVTEWWAGEDDQAAAENSGVPYSEGNGNVQQPKKPMNWTAVSAVVGGIGIALSLLK